MISTLNAFDWAWSQRIPATAKIVLVSLGWEARESAAHRCSLSTGYISERTRLSKRCVQYVLKDLELDGFIRRDNSGLIELAVGADVRFDHVGIPPQHKGPIISGVAYEVRLLVFKRDEFRCRLCGSERDITIDHIIARSRGGSNDESNLQTLCRRCNSSKGAS